MGLWLLRWAVKIQKSSLQWALSDEEYASYKLVTHGPDQPRHRFCFTIQCFQWVFNLANILEWGDFSWKSCIFTFFCKAPGNSSVCSQVAPGGWSRVAAAPREGARALLVWSPHPTGPSHTEAELQLLSSIDLDPLHSWLLHIYLPGSRKPWCKVCSSQPHTSPNFLSKISLCLWLWRAFNKQQKKSDLWNSCYSLKIIMYIIHWILWNQWHPSHFTNEETKAGRS